MQATLPGQVKAVSLQVSQVLLSLIALAEPAPTAAALSELPEKSTISMREYTGTFQGRALLGTLGCNANLFLKTPDLQSMDQGLGQICSEV